MIDENITFMLFGYTSDDLSPGSHRKVLCICDGCEEERLTPYQSRRDLCLKCSHNTKEYKSKLSKITSGKHHSKKTKYKMSKSKQGDKNSRWRGGKK